MLVHVLVGEGHGPQVLHHLLLLLLGKAGLDERSELIVVDGFVGFGFGQLHQLLGLLRGEIELALQCRQYHRALALGALDVRAHHLDEQRARGHLQAMAVRLPDVTVSGVDAAGEKLLDGCQHYRPAPLRNRTW